MVGPFIFFDQMGPSEFLLGQGMDVRPHPHIGLSTVTYLFDGEIDAPRQPRHGAADPAGRAELDDRRPRHHPLGAHRPDTASDRLPAVRHPELGRPDGPGRGERPAFEHYDAAALPVLTGEGKTVRLIAGEAFGARSPVRTSSPMVYADVALEAGAVLPLDPTYDERAIYTVAGAIEIAGDGFGPGQLLVFRPGDRISVRALDSARFMVLGGEPMDGPRHLWWNFVSSRPERIAQAKEDWRQGRFDTVPNDAEFIPLPEDPQPVRYP